MFHRCLNIIKSVSFLFCGAMSGDEIKQQLNITLASAPCYLHGKFSIIYKAFCNLGHISYHNCCEFNSVFFYSRFLDHLGHNLIL